MVSSRLVKLMDVFKSKVYPENSINNSFKTFLDNKHRMQEKLITVPKEPLLLVLRYFGSVSIKTRINL